MKYLEVTENEIVIHCYGIINFIFVSIKKIIITIIIMTVISILVYLYFNENIYISESSLYIVPKINYNMETYNDNQSSFSNQGIVEDYARILISQTLLDSVYKELKLSQQDNSISIKTNVKSNSWIIDVSCTCNQSDLAKKILEKTIEKFEIEVKDIGQLDKIIIINQPKENQRPVTPSISFIALVSLFLSTILTLIGITILYFIRDMIYYREIK